jgi:hypothetical protein
MLLLNGFQGLSSRPELGLGCTSRHVHTPSWHPRRHKAHAHAARAHDSSPGRGNPRTRPWLQCLGYDALALVHPRDGRRHQGSRADKSRRAATAIDLQLALVGEIRWPMVPPSMDPTGVPVCGVIPAGQLRKCDFCPRTADVTRVTGHETRVPRRDFGDRQRRRHVVTGFFTSQMAPPSVFLACRRLRK